jgi:hypothetical protein
VVLEAVAAVAGAGHTQGNLTLHAVERRPVKDTLVAVAPEAASLLASALFGAAKAFLGRGRARLGGSVSVRPKVRIMSFPGVGPARRDLVARCRPKSYLKSQRSS